MTDPLCQLEWIFKKNYDLSKILLVLIAEVAIITMLLFFSVQTLNKTAIFRPVITEIPYL